MINELKKKFSRKKEDKKRGRDNREPSGRKSKRLASAEESLKVFYKKEEKVKVKGK